MVHKSPIINPASSPRTIKADTEIKMISMKYLTSIEKLGESTISIEFIVFDSEVSINKEISNA